MNLITLPEMLRNWIYLNKRIDWLKSGNSFQMIYIKIVNHLPNSGQLSCSLVPLNNFQIKLLGWLINNPFHTLK